MLCLVGLVFPLHETEDQMANNSCFYLRGEQSVAPRFLVNLVTAIINIISAPFAVVSNLLIAVAIFNNLRLRTPSNLLIGCLALSDVLVGLAVQPSYITYRLLENQLILVPCFVRIVYTNVFFVCVGVSFMTLSAISYERFVAVRLLARYNNVFTSKRVVKYMVAIWICNILLTALQWAGIHLVSTKIHLIVWFVSLFVSVVANVGIVLILRRHGRQLQPSLHPITEQIRRRREERLARSIYFIVGVYLLFSIPVLFISSYELILQQDIKTYNHYSWSEMLAFLNSCTNPLICIWKNRQIRQGVKSTAKRLFSV